MALPPGFVLEQPSGINLPPGFVLEGQQPTEEQQGALSAGFKSYLPQLQETFGGVKTLLGVGAERALGEGEISRGLIESGARSMKEAEEARAPLVTPERGSFTDALDKGVGAVLTEWLPFQVGSGAAQLLEALTLAGAGAVAGSVVGTPGVGTATGAVTGVVARELAKKGVKEAAEKILKERGEDAAKEFFEQEAKKAAIDIGKRRGVNVALAGQAGFYGAGQTTSRAVEEAERLGGTATDIELARVLPAAAVSAAAEFIGDKILLGAVKDLAPGKAGKSAKLDLAKNILLGIVSTGTKEVPVEVIQSAAERYGAKLSLDDAKAIKEYVDAAAASYAMSVVPGGVRGVRTTMAEQAAKREEPEVEPPAPPVEPPRALEFKPEPYIQFPDGTVAKQSEVEAYIKTLPDDQQMAMRTKLLGLAPQLGTEFSPQEIAELEKQQAKAKRKPTAEELIAKARIKTGKPTTERDVTRIRDEYETAVIEGLLAQDAEMQRANELANIQREELAPQVETEPDVLGPAIAEVDQRVREGRIMARVQDLIDRNIPFASTAITDINDKLLVINEAPLTNEERNRIQNIMGMVNVFTGFVNLPQLAPRPVDTTADNREMEALIKERKERGPTEPLRATPVAPSPRVEEAPVSERVGEGAALRPEGGVEPSIAEDRELVIAPPVEPAPVVEAAAPAEKPTFEPKIVSRQPGPDGMEVHVFTTTDGYGTGLFDADAQQYVNGSVTRFTGADTLPKAQERAAEMFQKATPKEKPAAPAAPKAEEPAAEAPSRSSEAWRNEGKTSEVLIAEKVEVVGSELAGQIAEEASAKDFAPNDLPAAIQQWATDSKVPADDLRASVIKALDKFDISEARKAQVRKALSPIRAAARKAEAPAVEAPAVEEPTKPARVAKRRKALGSIMGSPMLADIFNQLGGLHTSLLSEFSTKFFTKNLDKKGRPIIRFRNPLISGRGALFNKNGKVDFTEIAEHLEQEGYLIPGSVERDYKEAGEQAKDLIKRALNKEEVLTIQEQIDKYSREAQEAARQAQLDREEENRMIAAGEMELEPEFDWTDEEFRENLGFDKQFEEDLDVYNLEPEDLRFLTDEELESELTDAEREQAEARRARKAEEDAARKAAESLAPGEDETFLATQSEEELRERDKAISQKEYEEKLKEANARTAERKEREQRDVKARALETVDDFELGRTAEEQMSGMRDMFEEPPAKPARVGTDTQIKSADKKASYFGATVVYQDGDLALMRAFSRLNGQPVYLPINGNYHFHMDIEYNPFPKDFITPEQRTELIKIKKDLEAKDKEAFDRNPSVTFDNGLSFSRSIPKEIKGIVEGWRDLLGLKANLYVTTVDEARADKDKFNGPHRAISSAGLDPDEAGSIRQLPNGDYYISFKQSTSKTRMLEILAHELGHMHEREVFKNADAQTQQKILDEHSKWLKSQTGQTAEQLVKSLRAKTTGKTTRIEKGMMADELRPYWKSFGEWYADQVSKWATTSEKPVSVVEKFFSRLGKALRNFYNKLTNQGYLPNETFVQYLEKAHQFPARLGPSGPMEPQDMKQKVETTGLPLFSKKGVSANQLKDFEQALRTLLNKFGLKDVGLSIIEGMQDAGSYAQQLIRIADRADNPIRTLRHEAIHALRELGFFTDAQWKSLSKMAKDKWIDQYLKQRNVDGKPLKAGEESRYDAYMREYDGDMEKITEEAVADAFADFDATKPPAGLLQTLLRRLRDFFQAMKSALTKVESVDQIFGKVEEGKLKPGEKAETGERKSMSGKRSTQEIARIFEKMVKRAESELSSALFNWNDSRLNEDKDKIIMYPGRDRKFARGKEGGKSNVSKAEFIDWLMSDGPFDTSVYGEDITRDAEWRGEIETLRSIVETPDIRKSLGGIRAKAAKAREDIIEAGRLGMQKRVPIQGGRLGEDINSAINKVFVPENATLIDKIENFKDRTWQRIAQGVADQFRTIKQYSEKGYMIATTSKSVDGAMETLLRYGELYNDGGALNVRKDTRGLLEALTPLGKEVDTFFVWLALNREASQPDNKKSEFIDPDTGEDLLAKLVAKRNELNQGKIKDPKTGFMVDRAVVYEKARKDMMKLNRSVLDIAHGKVTRKPGEKEPLFNAAIIDDEAFDKFINDAFFVPFYREMEGKGVEAVRNASGLTGQQFSKALKGSALPFADLYNNVLLNWSHILSAAMKNSAAVQTIEDALTYGGIEAVVPNLKSQFEWKNNKVYKVGTDELVGDGSLKWDQTTDDGKGVSMVMIDGNKTYFKVTDPLLFESISAIGYLGKSSKFLDMATTMAQWLRFGVTVSPVFRINNLLRDPVAAAAVAGGKLKFTPLNFVQNTIEGIRLYDPKNESYLGALAGGGIFNMGTRFEGDQSKLIKKLQAAGIKSESILDSDKKIRTALSTLWNKYEEYGNKAESAQRLKLYKTMRDKDMSHLEAVFYARDLMDYSKQGAWPAIRILMQTVPFLNARTQGLYKLGRDGIIPTARTLYNVVNGKSYDQLTEEEKKQRITDTQKAKAFSAVAGAAVAASLLLYFMYKDDEDFKKRDAWDRDNFFWFKVPGLTTTSATRSADGEEVKTEVAIRIPKPFEIGALATLVERITEQIVDENAEGKQFGDALSRMLVNTFAFDLPQIIRPAVDLYANKDNFTKAPIEGPGMERLSKAERMTPDTSPLAIMLSRVANILLPEKAEVSPLQMDYAMQAYFGWAGATVGVLSRYAMMPFNEGEYPDARWMDRASLGIVKELPGRSGGYVTSFYDNAKAINQAMADMRHYASFGQMEKAYEIQSEKMDKIQLYGLYQKVGDIMGNIRKQINMVKVDKTMSGPEKKQAIENMQQLMSEYAKMAEDIRKQQKK